MLQIINMLKGKRIIVFGTGNAAEKIMGKLRVPADYYVDNNPQKWQDKFLSKPVRNPSALLNENKGSFFILIASTYYGEISEQLRIMGFRENIDFFNTLNWFINPLELDLEIIAYDETEGIFKKISGMLELGFYEDAKGLLEQYQSTFPFDGRLYSMNMLITLHQGKLDEVRGMIADSISGGPKNYEMNLEFAQANRSIKCGSYLEAMDKCESLILKWSNTYDTNVISKIADFVAMIEKEHMSKILEELSKTMLVENLSEDDNEGTNVHLMLDHFICRRFIEALSNGKGKNKFIIFYDYGQKRHITKEEYSDIIEIQITRPYEKMLLQQAENLFCEAKAIYVHYLHDAFCWLLFKCGVRKNLNWVLWGADLYNHLNMDLYDDYTKRLLKDVNCEWLPLNHGAQTDSCHEIYRKSVIRKMSRILTWNRGDYELVKKNFITAAKHEHFFYNNPVDFSMLDAVRDSGRNKYDFHKEYKYVFLLGNSGDPTNNHISLLYKLKEYNRKDFCVVVPLGYGLREYIDILIVEGTRLLGEQFIPLNEFIQPEQYSQILSQVDAVFMNHRRQQGAGNILALLYLGKKIYMNVGVTTYSTFSDLGIKFFDIEQIGREAFEDMVYFEENSASSNRMLAKRHFDPDIISESFSRHFF